MAAAAETLNLAIPLLIDEVRPAESEVYGRSLRTSLRLGIFMVRKALSEAIFSPEADQAKIEFYTSVDEGFGTDMELGGGLEVRAFDKRPVIEGKVMAKDLKTAVSDMTAAGLWCAEATASKDPHFEPQLTRSIKDHDNALIVDQMARGETSYNTRIVISPFPEEAAAKSGDDYWRNIGYVPHLKRGFVQLYHITEAGLVTGSLSFDGSNKQHLQELLGKYGIDIPTNEVTDNWLQYAVTDNLSEEQAKALALDIADQAGDPRYKKTTNTVSITNQHRAIMEKVFNESYVHACESLARGYQTPDTRQLVFQLANKASQFNPRYAKALYQMRANEQRFTDDDMIVVHELLVYSTIELMRALLVRGKQIVYDEPALRSGELNMAYLQALDAQAFQSALSGFGAIGAKNNRIYSACGIAISLGGEGNDQDGSPQSAFGGADKDTNSSNGELEDCEFTSKECPKCHKKNIKTIVKKGVFYGACGCNSASSNKGKAKLALAA